MSTLHPAWRRVLDRQHSLTQHRTRRLLEGPQGAVVERDGRRFVNFSSNDYLGLANHPEVVKGLVRGAERYGVGSGASHLISGHGIAHHKLEEELAAFVGCERALLFSTGYMANLGTIAALAGRDAEVLEDRLNHASLLDGARLSRARTRRYPHGDTAALAGLLAGSSAAVKLVVSDGVFSMDGDIAPIAALARVSADAGAALMIDDAHGIGVLGPGGGGAVQQSGVAAHAVTVLVGTLGKAFGTFGAFVAGADEVIEFLLQTVRTYRYTTALPPAVAEATRSALRLAATESWRREHLSALVERFRTGAAALGFSLSTASTPIQIIPIGGNAEALAVGEHLERAGFWVGVIRPPTVPVGRARLRITFSAAHRVQQVDTLLDALAEIPPRDSA